MFRKSCAEEGKKWQFKIVMLYKQIQQEVGDDLGVCALNLQIVYGKSKSLDHVIKRSCNFMEGSSSFYATTLPCWMFLIYHVTTRDHVFKDLCDLVGGKFL